MVEPYHQVYARWQQDPQGFWREAAQAVDWTKPPTMIFDRAGGTYGCWFPDAELNTCHNALDRCRKRPGRPEGHHL